MKSQPSRHSVTLYDVAPAPFYFVFIGIPLAIIAVTVGAILLAVFLIRRARREQQAAQQPPVSSGTDADAAGEAPHDTDVH